MLLRGTCCESVLENDYRRKGMDMRSFCFDAEDYIEVDLRDKRRCRVRQGYFGLVEYVKLIYSVITMVFYY